MCYHPRFPGHFHPARSMASALFTPRMASALFSVMAVLRAPVPRSGDGAKPDTRTSLLRTSSPRSSKPSAATPQASFHSFASNLASTGTRYEQILADPTYNVLIGNSQHRITALWEIVLRADVILPESSLLPWLYCGVDVGQRVRISSDLQHIKRCFNFIQYEYSEPMDGMRGRTRMCATRENHGTNIGAESRWQSGRRVVLSGHSPGT